jgi:hypothetical protein
MRKGKIGVVFGIFMIILTISIFSFANAALEVTKEPISTLAIKDANLPALFKLSMKNLGSTESFNLYSVAGVDIKPNESFTIESGETKEIVIEAYPTFPLKVSPDYYSFQYKIRGASSGTTEDDLAISIAYLKDAFNYYGEAINPTSSKAIIHFDNKYGGNLNNIHLELSSIFFSQSYDFSLNANEKKYFEVPLNERVLRESLAGPYIVQAKVKMGSVEGVTTAILKFEEQTGIQTTETKEGFLGRRQEIDKTNTGNVKTTVEIFASRNLISSLFTSTSVAAVSKDFSGFKVNYLFQKELAPGETLKVVIKTNWWILVGIILAIIIIWYVIDNYIRNKITMRKTVSFVRTKGGEFAIRVNLHVKARDFVERIKILDRLPPMVKVFEKYGIPPEKIDERNRRLEWNIQALSKGEERTFSYIVYSKVGIVGRFELPQAEAIYEFNGKIKEASSNVTVFEQK